ncbi:MAG: 4-hydroxy-tetrahydrodipicolinate synthase [Gammaproteobacteria bacterium]
MFQGSIVALVTPMELDGAVDKSSLDRLIDWHIESGTEAIVAVGTTGESATLTTSEHCDVIAHVVERVDHRIPVIAGTGANATGEAIELTRCAQEAGADACLLVAPYYNKPTQEGLYRHYKAVAEAVPIAQILYNVPGRTACDILPETVARLAEIPNIVGIKEASDLSRVQTLLERVDASFAVYSGDDSMAMEALLAGARGVISVTANVAPQLMHEMCARALRGDRAGATALNERLMPLHEVLFVESNPIPVKWALHTMGLIPPGIRLPLTPLAEPHRPRVRAVLQATGLLTN